MVSLSVKVGNIPNLFIPTVTVPFYDPQEDFLGGKNIGNLPGVARAAYGSTVTNGVTTLSTATTFNNVDFINTVLDIRAAITFNNCRIVMTGNDYIAQDSIRALIRTLNGTGLSSVVFNDCEIHCRGQRVLAVAFGRNMTFNRCVLTGGVDGPDIVTSTGSAPVNYGVVMQDCWIGQQAWWRTSTTPWEGHGSDTQTHNDGSQQQNDIASTWDNCVFVTCANPWVGTGTPFSGSDDGNSFIPATGNGISGGGFNYIASKATQESWRATYLNYTSTPSQSYLGVTRQMSTAGSWAGIMANRNGGTVTNCRFSGGLAAINILDTNVTGSWSIKRCVFWNDMANGHGGNPTTKGHAILVRSGLNGIVDIPTTGSDRNLWFDGGTVSPIFL